MVSRPPTCHNVIAGRRRTRFLNVLKTGFPASPATLHGHAINCVPVHRFRRRRTPETGLTLAEWCEFPGYALARILMHAVKQSLRFLAGFRVVCCLFYRFPVGNALRPLGRCVQLRDYGNKGIKAAIGGFFYAVSCLFSIFEMKEFMRSSASSSE